VGGHRWLILGLFLLLFIHNFQLEKEEKEEKEKKKKKSKNFQREKKGKKEEDPNLLILVGSTSLSSWES